MSDQSGSMSMLRANKLIVVVFAVFFCLGEAIFWYLPETHDAMGRVVQIIASGILGGILGSRRSPEGSLFGDAFGVAWRVSAIWVVLAAGTEALITGDAQLNTMNFPTVVFQQALVILGGFIAGNLIEGLSSSRIKVSAPVVWTAIGACAAVTAAVFSIWGNVRLLPQPTDLQTEESQPAVESTSGST